MTYYAQVKKLADPIIKYYRDDLVKHDRNSLRNYKGEFIHITKETGTHLFRLIPYDEYPKAGEKVPYLFGTADRDHILKGCDISHIISPYGLEVRLVLWGRKGNVTIVTPEKAGVIVNEYIRKGLSLWATERRFAA